MERTDVELDVEDITLIFKIDLTDKIYVPTLTQILVLRNIKWSRQLNERILRYHKLLLRTQIK